MNTIAQKIGILSWTFYFFVSITGVSLHNLYCHCTDKAYVSFFSIDRQCHDHEEETDTCCEESTVKHNSHFNQQESEDCCSPNSKVVKANIDVLAVSEITELPIFPSARIAPKLHNFTFLYSFQEKIKLQSRPPPPLYGIDLCDFIQSYLC